MAFFEDSKTVKYGPYSQIEALSLCMVQFITKRQKKAFFSRTFFFQKSEHSVSKKKIPSKKNGENFFLPFSDELHNILLF